MSNCPVCGTPVDNNSCFCPNCGSAINQAPQQPNITQYDQQPDVPQYTQYGQQPDVPQYTQYGQQPNVPQYTQYGQPQMYMDPYGQQMNIPPAEPPRKKKSKTPLIITLVILAILGIAAIILFPLGGLQKIRDKKAQKEITQTAQSYLKAVEDLDVKKVAQMTAPKDLLKKIAKDALGLVAMYDSYALEELEDYTGANNTDEILRQFDTYYDMAINEAQHQLDEIVEDEDVRIELKNTQITSVQPTSLKEIIHPFFRILGDEEMSGFINEDNISQMANNYGENYGVDFNHLYAVYVKTDLTLEADDETISYDSKGLYELVSDEIEASLKETNLDIKLTDNNHGVRMLLAYEYNGQYYILPDPEAALLPSLIRYMEKSRMSTDLSYAHTIATAVQTAMGNEECYEYLTEEKAGQYIEFTETGLAALDSNTRELIMENFDDGLPEIQYTDNGAKYFTFKVDYDGYVYVYISDGDTPDTWEVYPDSYDYW